MNHYFVEKQYYGSDDEYAAIVYVCTKCNLMAVIIFEHITYSIDGIIISSSVEIDGIIEYPDMPACEYYYKFRSLLK